MAKVKEAKEEKVIDSKSILGGVLKEHAKEHLNFSETVHWKSSYGSLMLDYAAGGVTPGLIRLCGSSGGGKTALSLEIIRNIFDDVPNSKALWVIAEGRPPSLENKQRCGLKFVYSPEEWEIGTIFVLESNIYELFIKTVKELVLNNPANVRFIFVVDSMNGLITRNDATKEIEENNMVAGQAVLSKKMLQNLSLGLYKWGHSMILLSQITASIKIDTYAKAVHRPGEAGGGNSLWHGANTIINIEHPRNEDFILDSPNGKFNDGKSKVIGQNIRVTLNKTAMEESKKLTISYPIKYKRRPSGIWREREVGDSLMMWGLLEKSGSWFNFSEGCTIEAAKNGFDLSKKIQGMDNVYEFLSENPDICEYFYKYFVSIMSNQNS